MENHIIKQRETKKENITIIILEIIPNDYLDNNCILVNKITGEKILLLLTH